MEHFLRGLLPRLVPGTQEQADWLLIPHQGKSDLEKSIVRKLRGWRHPNARFLIVRDQDSADCKVAKQTLVNLAAQVPGRLCFVRIPCRELEAWYFGDLDTVGDEYDQPQLSELRGRALYRIPDAIVSPSREMERHLPGFGKVDAARRLGPRLAIDDNSSVSFQYFATLVRRLFPELTSA